MRVPLLIPRAFYLLLTFTISQASLCQSWKAQFRDSTDGAFDASQWMSKVYGFVPLANIITEPALDIGGLGALVFIKRKFDDQGNPKPVPPDIYGLGGMGTANGSWGLGGAYLGYWKEDRLRYRGAAGYGSFNLDYYRTGLLGNERRFAFNIQGFILVQEVSFRLLKAPLFAGLQYTFSDNKAEFESDLNLEIPGVNPGFLDTRTGGLGPLLTYDSRDNLFTPNKGLKAQLLWQYYDEIFGGKPRFHRFHTFMLGYVAFNPRLVGSIRLDARFASERTPFYSLPYVELRGVPALRYQGNQVYVVETEERWNFNKRWSVVGFAGWGKGIFEEEEFSEADNAWNMGGGIRYLLARLFGLYAGADIARGPEDWAFYIVFGSSWARL